MKRRRIYLAAGFLVVLAVAVMGCGGDTRPVPRVKFSTTPPPPAEIAATNAVRRTLGLREIDADNWYFYGTCTYGDGESNQSWKTSKDGDQCKVVHYSDSGTILLEEDLYYTGRTLLNIDQDNGLLFEHLYLQYDYVTEATMLDYTGRDPRIHALFGLAPPYRVCCSSATMQPPPTLDEIRRLADKILAMWGMERL